MKKNILLLPILFFSSFGFSQKKTTEEQITRILIVRHAEKADDGTKNPSLSDAGKIRAERLNKMLSEFSIDKLYSTPYARTTETIQPIASSRNLAITNYNPSDKNFALNLFKIEKGKTTVVVGHSNTGPGLANFLINETKYYDLDESDYGKIWIITFKNDKLIDCILLNY
jgi:phosphohistidine phosphatase SixA